MLVLPPAPCAPQRQRGLSAAEVDAERHLLDRHLRPVCVEFIGEDHRQRGLDALPDLRAGRADDDAIVRLDADEDAERVLGNRCAVHRRPTRLASRPARGRARPTQRATLAGSAAARRPPRARSFRCQRCGARDCAPDADVGSAAAEVRDRVDVRRCRIGIALEQCDRCQDLAGLAVAALGHVLFDPGLLHGVQAVLAEPLDRGDASGPRATRPAAMQERIAAPSTSTVQAPQKPPPQPNLVPVRRA